MPRNPDQGASCIPLWCKKLLRPSIFVRIEGILRLFRIRLRTVIRDRTRNSWADHSFIFKRPPVERNGATWTTQFLTSEQGWWYEERTHCERENEKWKKTFVDEGGTQVSLDKLLGRNRTMLKKRRFLTVRCRRCWSSRSSLLELDRTNSLIRNLELAYSKASSLNIGQSKKEGYSRTNITRIHQETKWSANLTRTSVWQKRGLEVKGMAN